MAKLKKTKKSLYMNFFVVAGVAVAALLAAYLLLGKNSPSQDLQSKAAVSVMQMKNSAWDFCEIGTAGCKDESSWSGTENGAKVTIREQEDDQGNVLGNYLEAKVVGKSPYIINNSTVELPEGKKELSVTLRNVDSTKSYSYKIQLKYKGSNEWRPINSDFKISGKGSDYVTKTFNLSSKANTVSAMRITFPGASLNQIINIDEVKITVSRYVGPIEVKGTLSQKDGKYFINESKTKVTEIRNVDDITSAMLNNKQKVKVYGEMKYDNPFTGYIQVSKIESLIAEESIGDPIDLSGWSLEKGAYLNTEEDGLAFFVGDQEDEAKVVEGSALKTKLGRSLPKGKKRVNLRMAVDSGVTPKVYLMIQKKGSSSWDKKQINVNLNSGSAEDYAIDLADSAVTVDALKIYVTGATSAAGGTSIKVEDINFVKVGAGGTVTKSGRYVSSSQTIKVSKSESYKIKGDIPETDANGITIKNGTPIKVTGILDGTKKPPEINIDEGSFEATMAWVSYPEYAFDEDGETNGFEGVNLKSLTAEDGKLVALTKSGATGSVRLRPTKDEAPVLTSGDKKVKITLSAVGKTAGSKAVHFTVNNSTQYRSNTNIKVVKEGEALSPTTWTITKLPTSKVTLKELTLQFTGLAGDTKVYIDDIVFETYEPIGTVAVSGIVTKTDGGVQFKAIRRVNACKTKVTNYMLTAPEDDTDGIQAAINSMVKGKPYTVKGAYDPAAAGSISTIVLNARPEEIMGVTQGPTTSCKQVEEEEPAPGDSCTSKPGCYWKKSYTNCRESTGDLWTECETQVKCICS